MTGFAQDTLVNEQGIFHWEIRTLNHRYLDITIRLPETMRAVESVVREKLKGMLNRGKIDCQLKWQPGGEEGQRFVLNENLLNELIHWGNVINTKLPGHPGLSPTELLRWPEMLQPATMELDKLTPSLMESLQSTLDKLISMRATEGIQLEKLIKSRLDTLRELVKIVHGNAEKSIQQNETKLKQRLAGIQIDYHNERLEQELVHFAQRVDVAEEVDRLETHLDVFYDTLTKGGIVGRRLDFLSQELNREVNTIASKSQSVEISQATVDMKVLVEQIREQVQNIE